MLAIISDHIFSKYTDNK